MNTGQKLNQAVHELTRSHVTTHDDLEGGGKRSFHTDPESGATVPFREMPLFEQLRQERVSSTRRSGASGSGSRAPVAIPALVLWNEIQETLNTRMVQIDGKDRPDLSPEAKLQRWAAHTLQDPSGGLQQQCLRTIVGWAMAIQNLLHPVRKTEILGTCPECRETHAWSWQEDEWIRNTALAAVGLDVTCGACGSQWCGAEAVTSLAVSLRDAA